MPRYRRAGNNSQRDRSVIAPLVRPPRRSMTIPDLSDSRGIPGTVSSLRLNLVAGSMWVLIVENRSIVAIGRFDGDKLNYSNIRTLGKLSD